LKINFQKIKGTGSKCLVPLVISNRIVTKAAYKPVFSAV